jgi:hypothetical protein
MKLAWVPHWICERLLLLLRGNNQTSWLRFKEEPIIENGGFCRSYLIVDIYVELIEGLIR